MARARSSCSTARLLDIAASEGSPFPLPAGLEAVLVVEAETHGESDRAQLMKVLAGWCEAGGATHVELAMSTEAELKLWALRHAASPILNRLAPRLQSMQLVEDGCVPPARFAAVRARRARGARARATSAA